MIYVVNKRTHKPTKDDIYIGRPTVLGNPFTHLEGKTKAEFVVDSREDAVAMYKDWLREQYRQKQEVRDALRYIVDKNKEGDIYLVCWCAPLACHGDVLKEIVGNWEETLPPEKVKLKGDNNG